MKYLTLLLLLPLFILAQNNNYNDRVIFKNHQKHRIAVRIIVDEMLYYRYGTNMQKAIGMGAVDSLFIDPLGLVYTAEKGYLTDRSAIDAVLQSHSKNVDEIQLITKNRGFLGRFSLALSFIPYSSTLIRQYNYSVRSSVYPAYSTTQQTETKFEFELAYALNNQLNLIGSFTVDQNNDFLKNYYKYDTSDPQENEETSNTGSTAIAAGLRYYLTAPDELHSRFFLVTLGGIEMGHVKFESKQIQPPDESTYHDNINDYYGNIFSPYFVTVGFGGEYRFNDGISLIGQVKFRYRSAQGDYKNEQTDPITLQTQHRELSSIDTRIGLGLNFHF